MAKAVEEKLELMKDIVNSEVEAAYAAQLLVVSSCWRTPASTTKKTARTRMLMATRSSPVLAKMADVYCSSAFGTAHRAPIPCWAKVRDYFAKGR